MQHQDFDNPYFFQLRVEERKQGKRGRAFEEEVIREQRQTLFQADPNLRRLFRDDFEAYARALDHHEQLMRELRAWIGSSMDGHGEYPLWSDGTAFDKGNELTSGQMGDGEDEEVYEEDGELNDPLFLEADEWAVRAHRWSHTLYYNKKIRDRDLFRVHANAFAVADFVYASCEVLELEGVPEAAALETAVRELCIGRTFLACCMESFAALLEKRIGATRTVRQLHDTTVGLQQMFSDRIGEWEARLKALGRWEYFSSRKNGGNY